MMFPQFAVGPSYKTDMLYLTKSTVNWWCVLMEFKNPNAKLFQDHARGPRRHSDFIAALDQVDSWKRHLRRHKAEFISRWAPVLTPLGTHPVSFKFILIIGRRREFINDAAKLETFASYEDGDKDLRVMTYDSLISATEYAGYPEEFHLMKPFGTKIRFEKVLTRETLLWKWLGPDQLVVTEAQVSELRKAGLNIDAWLKPASPDTA